MCIIPIIDEMTVENWEKIKQVFDLAIERPKESRVEFLREYCGENVFLIEEVESLIDAHDEAANVIENNAFNFDSITGLQTRSYEGKHFGNYKILREIGRGGMGAVFLAERADGEFSREVALKIVRQTILDAETERHFRRERDILALLNHPNIAQLYDGGVSDAGEAFLAMEYVKGETLTEYAEKLNLSIEEKLKLFLKICAAVAYAHRNLTVHRDIKPSNILVAENGEPKLLDFGLAKFIDESLAEDAQTKTVFRAFTPAYASPEQILGKTVTTVSDVYSLGVVFYELLTGEKPFHFEGKSLEEILRTIEATEPLRPSSIGNSRTAISNSENEKSRNSKFLVGDLDNIALKALRKEPERRYKSVEAFADDIERYLKGLPIAARPNTLSYRASKFFRRNRVAVSAAALIFLALFTGLTVALWQARIARAERDRAESRFQDVRTLSNSLLFEISPKIERLQGSTEAREILVSRALKYLDSLAKESQNDLPLQSELAAAYEKIGDLQGNPRKANLSDFFGAKTSFKKARAIRQNLLEQNSADFENRRMLAANYNELSKIEYWTDDLGAAEKDSDAALKFYEQMLAENPDSRELKLAFADASLERASFLYTNNRLAESYPYLRKPIEMLEELKSRNAADTEAQILLARGYRQLGSTLSWDEKQSEAETEAMKAIALSEKTAAENPNDAFIKQELAKSYYEASSVYEEIDNPRSLQFAEQALKIYRENASEDSSNIQARQYLAQGLFRVAAIYVHLDKPDAADANLLESIAIFTDLEKSEPKNPTYKTDLATDYKLLGASKMLRKNYAGAIAEYEKAVVVYQEILSQSAEGKGELRHLALTYEYIGEAFEESGKGNLENAAINYRKSLELYAQLESLNALTEYDRKSFEKLKIKVRKLSQ